MNLKNYTLVVLLFLGFTAQAQLNFTSSNPDSKIQIRAAAELGYLAVLSHKIQFSNDGGLEGNPEITTAQNFVSFQQGMAIAQMIARSKYSLV